jgi:hypothetical protein
MELITSAQIDGRRRGRKTIRAGRSREPQEIFFGGSDLLGPSEDKKMPNAGFRHPLAAPQPKRISR